MCKYQGYEKYKESGVEWLGDIPEHWVTKKIQHVGRLKSGENIVSQQIEKEGLYPVFGGNGLRGYFDSYTHDGHYILIGRQGALCGNINYGNGKFWASEHAVVVLPSSEFNVYWLGGLLETMNLNQYSTSAAQPGLSAEQIGRLKIPFPPLDEQESIACFLDRKTSQIDTLIAKKEALLEKLDEKRTALISHAVTKGLDPSVPMKDSGVKWLGDIPEHWEIQRIKFIGDIKYGLGEPPEKLDDGLPIIRATDIFRGIIDGSKVQRVNPDKVPWSRNPELKTGDILVVRSGAYTGDSAIVTNEWAGSIAGYDMVITPTKSYPKYIAWNLLSKHVLEGQLHLAKSRAAQPHLNAEELGNTIIAASSLNEQEMIAEYLDRETAEIDRQKAKVKEAIELLKEYRTALITNAVTGKIDVRQVVNV